MNTIKINPHFEDFIWMSYRYCIGRKTIASCMHSDTILELIHNNPDILTKERIAFMVKDIRREINNHLQFKRSLHIEGFADDIDIFSNLMYSLNDIYIESKMIYYFDVNSMSIYDSKRDESLYEFERPDSDYDDLIPWVKLANCLDISCHKNITLMFEGKQVIKRCYPFPMSVRIDNKVKYHKVWTSILDDNVSITKYIPEEYIMNIK